jgi:hypothetical protein
MAELSNFPYFEVEFTKQGSPAKPQQINDLSQFLTNNPNITDLIVISHGWNNNNAEALDLYKRFFTSFRKQLNGMSSLAQRQFAILGVIWPSKKFADKDLIPAGAAAASLGNGPSLEKIHARLDDLSGFFSAKDADSKLKQAAQLLDELEDSPAARKKFVALIRGILSKDAASKEDASDIFFKLEEKELLDRLSAPLPTLPTAGGGGGAAGFEEGSAAGGVGDAFGGLVPGITNLLNFTTYYEMKERAGLVGRKGLNPLLKQLRGQFASLRLHLVGHSFGGRLVTSAALAPTSDPSLPLHTLVLLQAAFSHNGFAKASGDLTNDGAFRSVVTAARVAGPILITHTKNDLAVGIAYPIASRLANQVASALGDENDPYGGIGRNGAIKTPESVKLKLLPKGSAYSAFADGKVYNLLADDFVKDHGDVTDEEIAYMVLTAMANNP